MDNILLAVKHKGECKLISVSATSGFGEFTEELMGKWSELIDAKFSCLCSVGSITNICLDSENDLKNLIMLCNCSDVKVVVAELCVPNSENVNNCASSVPSVGDEQMEDNHVGCEIVEKKQDDNNNELNLGNSNKSKQLVEKKQDSQLTKYKKTITSRQLLECGDTSFNHPCYDLTPRKALLSDNWAYIMKEGVGSEFRGGASEFRTELIKYSTQVGFKFKYVRNDTRYIHVVCNDAEAFGCDWFMKAKRQAVTNYFEVAKANLVHKCVGKMVRDDTCRLGPNIMGNLVLQNVRNKPTMGAKEVMKFMKDGYGIDVPYWKAWRAVEAARNIIFGSYDESYDQLRWYCQAIVRTNPGSVAALEPNVDTHHFERVFVAFKACIEGFKRCHPMLFIDGTFMKGRTKCTLLSATAKDGDNGLFPVAFAIVSAENTTNWTWFLEKLREFLEHDRKVFYISDRNCELMTAFNMVFDEPVHFYCLYHLLIDLKSKFPSGWSPTKRSKMEEHFKECAYAPNKQIFEEKVSIFKEAGGKCSEEWIAQLPYEKWAVAYSPHVTRYREMTSNAAEPFNSWIQEAKELPITHMIDSIRIGISSWYTQRREESKTWTGALVKSKEELWSRLTNIGQSWFVKECPAGDYEVSTSPPVRVDLRTRSCSCSQWQVTGFPCSHAVAVIRRHNESVFSHVEECFFASKYRECYMFDIHPIPETERYECLSPVKQPKILPPLKRGSRRPKKQRIAADDNVENGSGNQPHEIVTTQASSEEPHEIVPTQASSEEPHEIVPIQTQASSEEPHEIVPTQASSEEPICST